MGDGGRLAGIQKKVFSRSLDEQREAEFSQQRGIVAERDAVVDDDGNAVIHVFPCMTKYEGLIMPPIRVLRLRWTSGQMQ